jgi:epoxyqueuosine reductase
MDWLRRNAERICDPRSLLPGGRSLLIVGVGHARPALELQGGGRVARYAAGRDYHNTLGRGLRRLARRLEQAGLGGRWRRVVDAGPLLERSHAAAAGLGFESRAANLLNPRFGPWFFLGELLLEEELEPTPAPPAGSCGTCTACLDACPTEAIREPGVVDSRLCLSYHTIENRGSIPPAIREALGDWTFGCDICSEVCPWGRKAPEVSDGIHPALEGSLVDWLRHTDEQHPELFQGSALRRAKREGLARNAALALGQVRSEEGRDSLIEALTQDDSPRVREAAGWSLAHGYGRDAGVADALDLAQAREVEPQAEADLRASRERWNC